MNFKQLLRIYKLLKNPEVVNMIEARFTPSLAPVNNDVVVAPPHNFKNNLIMTLYLAQIMRMVHIMVQFRQKD